MAFTACLFLLIGATSYAVVGCQIPGNRLFAIGSTALDLNVNRGAVVMAYLFMQLHITIAMSVVLNPVLYILERGVLSMHKRPLLAGVDEESPAFESISTLHKDRVSVVAGPSVTGPIVTDKYMTLRICVVVILLVLAIIFKDHFDDFTDFVGAWAVSMGSR
ncbi:hypothetical protein PHYSODRAFT_254036 [Phytophthora sojae]|uniref:Amino acid transporter transmembrane domain-containing protein n=1 Tax=Phytophthora sojae (strain P6497) TaxID=1094619 RepID=G5A8Q7_PHYSP|nr:hypothetical protein PHYSODRAFT_254036 [Phytophthora sojae]EGZ08283.1 hypothetical protein PHYSODRAFT_254036 [Phytophthora sojae]|eukprot:XP_009536455.1 hypothetical protein PHYSODRAFT_254036 [Phytophthora sojae]